MIRRLVGHVTPAGRALLALGIVAGVGAWVAGFAELGVIAWLCGLLLLAALPFLLIPAPTRGHLVLRPSRNVVGNSGACALRVTNDGSLSVRNPLVHIPVGDRSTAVRMPVLRPGVPHEETIAVKAHRRGVLTVGPALARRSDPLGLLVREDLWAPAVELLVRPRMVALGPIGTGAASDLEGAPSDQVSMSDLAFHALREYVRGDDLRHVHWRSSARAGQLHVRQYHDSRRSRAVVVVDGEPASYQRTTAFELAMSVAASVLVRLCDDGYDVTFGCGPHQVVSGTADDLLDATCRVKIGDGSLALAAQSALGLVGSGGLVVLVTGDRTDLGEIESARALFPADVAVLVVRTGWRSRKARDKARAAATKARATGRRRTGSADVDPDIPGLITVRELESLPMALRIATRQGLPS